MKDFAFAQPSRSGLPRQKRLAYAVAALIYISLLALVLHIRTHPTRVSSAGSTYGSMTAYVPGAIGGGAPAAPKPVAPKKNALTTKTSKAPAAERATAVGTSGVAGSGQGGSGPVRLGSGGNLTLLKKVTPAYPPLMQTARVSGRVILDATIHADGTIGDITVLQATNDAFAQSAIAAVKQWQYTPIGFEGIVTVTVNFTLPG